MERLTVDFVFCIDSQVAPNRGLGRRTMARLISHAGSLTNLAKYPASTVTFSGRKGALPRLEDKG